MSTKNDGGCAFPQPDLTAYGIGPRERADGTYDIRGMTLRDWFAGQAVAGMTCKEPWFNAERMAVAAYAIADAMLAAREGR